MSPRTSTRRPTRRPRRARPAARRAAAPAAPPPPIADEPVKARPVAGEPIEAQPVAPPAPPSDPVVSVEDGEVVLSLPDLPLADPERGYAVRVPPPPPARPVPDGRRAIFFDVENSSHAPYIERMIGRLGIDRGGSRTDFVAVGNWRVIGLDTARLLARHGAQLVHSAPATGVRDWSDLRIAVTAGVWLAAARPGDVIEIVSDDRAFDAVGDVAATLGIEFHRLSYRGLSGEPGAEIAQEPAPSRGHRRGRRSRRGGGPSRGPSGDRGGSDRRHHPPAARPAAAPSPAPAAAEAEPHTAPHDEIVHVVQELVDRANGRPVLIDTLARELKARGFARPPGSPRLITRLRRIRELSVSQTGMISLLRAGHARTTAPVAAEAEPFAGAIEPSATTVEGEEAMAATTAAPDGKEGAAATTGRRRGGASRRRRRGGRGRKRAPA